MKHQPSPIHSVLLAALLLGGSLGASAAENTGGQPNPPATPTWTVGATPAPSNHVIKTKSIPSNRVSTDTNRETSCPPPYVWNPKDKKCVLNMRSPLNPESHNYIIK